MTPKPLSYQHSVMHRRKTICENNGAIDFDMQIDREPNPKGDRVRISMSGKFLPYKYYGNEQGIPEVGYKED